MSTQLMWLITAIITSIGGGGAATAYNRATGDDGQQQAVQAVAHAYVKSQVAGDLERLSKKVDEQFIAVRQVQNAEAARLLKMDATLNEIKTALAVGKAVEAERLRHGRNPR